MKLNYTTPKYDKYRKWIREARSNNYNWNQIKYGLGNKEEDLNEFLLTQTKQNFWTLENSEWEQIVIQEESAEIYSLDADIYENTRVISIENNPNKTEPQYEDSCWQQYAQKLREKYFKEDSIEAIKKSTLKILKNLKLSTSRDNPIKGMVVGNVQSGKTANMAALMSMAADYGWNFFIVLSGTIENLRVQTQNRLIKDLGFPSGNLIFQGLNDLKLKSDISNSPSNIYLSNESRIRYLYVCLKNSTRLTNLLQWINKDQAKKSNMKILLIDDEADQAGINTADIDEQERKKINQLIINLVFSKNQHNQHTTKNYKAMNYIGYTATPYANLLNETSEVSLYPHSFIAVLGVSKEYFGPQQIFGVEGNNEFNGLDIVNQISDDKDKKEIEIINQIHKGLSSEVPKNLQNAIAWFLVSVAALRAKKFNGSLSMLIHTSQKQSHHDHLYSAIHKWLKETKKDFLYGLCRRVWKDQTQKFTYNKLYDQYPKYGNLDVQDYPDYSLLEDELAFLIESNPSNILFDSDQELIYSNEVHLCIDNCKYNGVDDEGKHLRLKYPDDSNFPQKAPAFIVIGGSTLSRGLTIEGLISTYFLRPVGQADTLMQMGRWFGYRKGYELYPRLWLTKNTITQFQFLSKLDDELRKEIHNMELRETSPSEYAIKILNSPRLRFINITSKNKMQSVELAEVDYSGFINHVTSFYSNHELLEKNLAETLKFIDNLKNPRNEKNNINPHSIYSYTWENVNNEKIIDYVSKLVFPNQPEVFLDISYLEKWLSQMFIENKLNPWNVVLAGTKNGETFSIGDLKLNLVSRSKKNTSTEEVIKLGVLRNPNDLFSDIYVSNSNTELYQLLSQSNTKLYRKIRSIANLDKTPLMIVYIVNKDSKASIYEGNKYRVDLNATNHLVGIYIQIPGGEKGVNHVTKIQAKLIMDFDKGDIE